jgi:hypothetical protein
MKNGVIKADALDGTNNATMDGTLRLVKLSIVYVERGSLKTSACPLQIRVHLITKENYPRGRQ